MRRRLYSQRPRVFGQRRKMEEEKRHSFGTIDDVLEAIKKKMRVYDEDDRLIDRKFLTRGLGPRFHEDDSRETLRERFLWMLCFEGCYAIKR